jgi:hypothetical protein
MNLKELACEGVDCIQLDPNRIQCQALVNKVINSGFHKRRQIS